MAFKSITVQELINLLKDEEPEAMVAFVSDYGDHHHTQQVHSIAGKLEEELISTSGYSDSGYALSGDSGDDVILVIR